MSVKIVTSGLEGLRRYFETLPDVSNKAAALAINDVAGGTGMTMMRKRIYEEVAFPKGYLDKDTLGLTKRATPQNLEATITGRSRPTSLARFALGGQSPKNTRGRGVRIMVKPGKAKMLDGAWLVPLRSGNVGLAVRLRPGSTFKNKIKAPSVRLANGVYLLYGPSVDQVLLDVAHDNVDELGNMIESEFFRQFRRLSNG